jgi:hypothetical protein
MGFAADKINGISGNLVLNCRKLNQYGDQNKQHNKTEGHPQDYPHYFFQQYTIFIHLQKQNTDETIIMLNYLSLMILLLLPGPKADIQITT